MKLRKLNRRNPRKPYFRKSRYNWRMVWGPLLVLMLPFFRLGQPVSKSADPVGSVTQTATARTVIEEPGPQAGAGRSVGLEEETLPPGGESLAKPSAAEIHESAETNDAPAAERYVAPFRLNIRRGPSDDFSIIGTLIQGERVEILSQVGSWVKIDEEMYVAARFLTDRAPKERPEEKSFYVTSHGTPSRSKPAFDAPINGRFERGDIVMGLELDEWLQIGSGRFIQKSDLSVEKIARESSQTMYVHAGKLNVRSGAGITYPVKYQLEGGRRVRIMRFINDWAQIDHNAYVSRYYLTSSPKAAPTVDSNLKENQILGFGAEKSIEHEIVRRVQVVVESLNERRQPSILSPVNGQLKRGETITVVAKVGPWLETKEGHFVFSRYVSDATRRLGH